MRLRAAKHSWVRLAATAALVALALAVVTGCSASEGDSDEVSGGHQGTPGIETQPDGGARASGYLNRSELEGGFWVLTAEESEESLVVAVLVGAEDLGMDLEDHIGELSIAEGTLVEGGASVRMAGPELEVDSLTVESAE
jgi:hypothetical protein